MRTSLALVALWLASYTVPAFAQETAETTPDETNNTAASDEAKSENESQDEEAEAFDELKFVTKFQALLRDEKYEEAEKQLDETIEKHPEAVRLHSLHGTAYSHLRRANRREDALRHMAAYVDHQMKNAARSDRYTTTFSQLLGMLIDETSEVSGPERASAVLDEFASGPAESFDETAAHVPAAIEARRILFLVKAGRVDEAKARIDERLNAAEAALAQSPAEAAAILRNAAALKDRVQLEDAVEGGDPNTAWTRYSEFLFNQLKEHPALSAVRERFAKEHLDRAMMLASTDPDTADGVLARLESVIKGDADTTDGESAAADLSEFEPQIAQVKSEIAQQRRLLALVGSPAAFPENVDGWVNGDPLTPASLKGKVVLLDFFAVWCGPCIATFPHLRQWHDDFSDNGLQIIGVTSYYQYGWNEETSRIERGAAPEPEAERAAMVHFIKHHELRHPVAYVTDRQLQEFYVVSGIPHAVLIDRQGKVRLFRIGSGDANAAEIEKAIKECLEESPPEA